jgi:predicted DNA-binding transcriptional regulator YafY
MSRRLERLLKIDSLLRFSQRQISVSLAETLEVSERTIRDDLAFLRDRYDAPLEYRKNQGWHYTDDQWRLPTVSLSTGELFALTLGARMLESYSGSAFESELKSSIKRLSERLPENTWVDLQKLAEEQITFRSGAQMLNLEPQIWTQLLDSCRDRKKIWMRYYAASHNSESERIVDPYFLDIYRGTNPYLIAFCNNRQEIREFRVDRIRELRILPEIFEIDPNFDVKAYQNQKFQYQGGNQVVAIAIWFDAQTAPYIRERIWHSSQSITEHDDGSLTLHLKTAGLQDLKRWVLGYGKGAKVLEPTELIDLVKAEVKQIYQLYFE